MSTEEVENDNKSLSAEEYKNKGNEAFKSNNVNEAIEFYTKAIELDPKNLLCFSNRSVSYLKLEKYEDALKDADSCIELRPSWAKGYFRKGTALHNLKRLEEAKVVLEKAAELDEDDDLIKKRLVAVKQELRKLSGKESDEEKPNNRYQGFGSQTGGRHFYRSPSPLKTATKCSYTTKNGITLEVCSGDITKEKVDAICNAANSNLM
jgi:tetratricopeptide (TPR) repeat protein